MCLGLFPYTLHKGGGFSQRFRERWTGRCTELIANVFAMGICGQMPRSGVASVVVAKDEGAVCRHVMIGVLQPRDRRASLNEFFDVECGSVGKRR